jgi:hypothetical protein
MLTWLHSLTQYLHGSCPVRDHRNTQLIDLIVAPRY